MLEQSPAGEQVVPVVPVALLACRSVDEHELAGAGVGAVDRDAQQVDRGPPEAHHGREHVAPPAVALLPQEVSEEQERKGQLRQSKLLASMDEAFHSDMLTDTSGEPGSPSNATGNVKPHPAPSADLAAETIPIPSPISTGGGGERLEQQAGAYALALLLARATAPVLLDSEVVEVHFQTRHPVANRRHSINR